MRAAIHLCTDDLAVTAIATAGIAGIWWMAGWLGLPMNLHLAVGIAASAAGCAVARGFAWVPPPMEPAVPETTEPDPEPGRADDLPLRAIMLASDLVKYSSFTQVLREQMADVNAVTEQASLDILSRLQAIDAPVQDLLTFLGQSSGNQRVVDLIDHTERQMTANRDLLRAWGARRDQTIQELERRIQEVDQVVDDLASSIQCVREIAHQTSVLAINTAIESSHAGKHGAGFTVIAGEVKRLSQQSDQAAVMIGNGVSHLRQVVGTFLKAILVENVMREKHEMDHLSASVADLTDNLERLISHQRDVLAKAHRESENIAHPLMELMGSIQFQDITRQQLDHVSGALAILDDHIGEVRAALTERSGDETFISLEGKLDEIFSHYVMGRQRRAHLQATSRDGYLQDCQPSVEIF